MSLSTNSLITWEDISNLLTNVNEARTRFGLSTTTLTDSDSNNTMKASTVEELYNALKACNGLSLGSNGTLSVVSISVPTVGSLISPSPLEDINNEATRIKGLNFSFFSNFSFRSSFDGSSFNSNFSFKGSSFNGSSFNGSSFNSSNFSFFSSGDSAFGSGGNSSFQGPIGIGTFFTCKSF